MSENIGFPRKRGVPSKEEDRRRRKKREGERKKEREREREREKGREETIDRRTIPFVNVRD